MAEAEIYRRHGCCFCSIEVSCLHTKQRGVTAIRTDDYTENREARYRLPNVTTMEKLSMQVSAGEGAVLKYDDHVLVTDHAWKGFIAGIYEFIETPDEIDGGECECRLNLIAFPKELFIDGGHAIA